MSSEGSQKAVIAALLGNAGVAIAKFVAFLLTASSAMLAESFHSVADTGNQALLLFGGKRSRQPADVEHPFGYGRNRYFYAFVVAVVLFALGALFSIYEGYHKLVHPEPVDDVFIAIGVLLVAMVFEGYSLHTAYRQTLAVKRAGRSWWGFIRHSKGPELPVVLLEDTAAELGLVVALIGISLAAITGDPFWDGLASVVIGILLGFVAAVLAIETKSMLLGEAAAPDTVRAISEALVAGPEISRVIHLRTLHLGPEELLVAAKIAVTHDETAREVARGIDAAERRVREAVPIAHLIYLEPDLYDRDMRPDDPVGERPDDPVGEPE